MATSNYLSPMELIKIYPQVTKLGWTVRQINFFAKSRVLKCIPTEEDSFSFLICEDSFVKLMNYSIPITQANEILRKEMLN